MATFEEYSNKYQNIRLERRDGILQMTLHTNGDTLQWGDTSHKELGQVFTDIGNDRGNKVVIMTGAGDAFSGPRASRKTHQKRRATDWDNVYWEGKHLLMNLLDIEVPMISAVNGPALRHFELPLLCDIVLASEDATFQDSGHFINGAVPGDGMHIICPMLMGVNRGRYFLLTGQELTAQQSYEMGLVAEVLPKKDLLPRAWALAEEMVKSHPLVLRYTRVVLTEYLKRQMQDILGYGLAVEGLAVVAADED